MTCSAKSASVVVVVVAAGGRCPFCPPDFSENYKRRNECTFESFKTSSYWAFVSQVLVADRLVLSFLALIRIQNLFEWVQAID